MTEIYADNLEWLAQSRRTEGTTANTAQTETTGEETDAKLPF